MDFFLDYRMIPYSISAMVFLIFVMIEIISLLIGIGVFDFLNDIDLGIDHEIDLDSSSFTIGSFFGYINPKKVPFSMLLMVMFFIFSFFGAMIQDTLGYLPLITTIPVALILTLFFLRYISTFLSFILPKIETQAVKTDSFMGKEATIIDKVSKKDYPARAKLLDEFRGEHYIRVEPLEENEEYKEGDRVLVVQKKKKSNIFYVDISLWDKIYNRKVKI